MSEEVKSEDGEVESDKGEEDGEDAKDGVTTSLKTVVFTANPTAEWVGLVVEILNSLGTGTGTDTDTDTDTVTGTVGHPLIDAVVGLDDIRSWALTAGLSDADQWFILPDGKKKAIKFVDAIPYTLRLDPSTTSVVVVDDLPQAIRQAPLVTSETHSWFSRYQSTAQCRMAKAPEVVAVTSYHNPLAPGRTFFDVCTSLLRCVHPARDLLSGASAAARVRSYAENATRRRDFVYGDIERVDTMPEVLEKLRTSVFSATSAFSLPRPPLCSSVKQ
jgi:hypothetical protein